MKQSDTDSNHPIPYKYIDADNKIYKDPYLNNNNEESSEEVSGKQSDNMRPQNIKKSKFLSKGDMSEDELYELIEEKNGQLIDLNKKTKKLKTKLTSIIKMLNEKIAENAEILYKKEINPLEFQWLTEQYEAKRKTLQIEQKINHSYKIQYNILQNKLKNRNNVKEMKNANLLSKVASKENDINSNTQSLKSNSKTNLVNGRLYMNVEDQINIIKNENKDILSKINEIKNKKISQKKEVDVIISGDLESQLKSKAEELQQIKILKKDAIEKFNTTNRAIEMMNKKVEHYEEKINEINQNEYEDEDGGQGGGGALDNYIFWLEIIKDEITNRNQEELLELIKEGNSNFINELKKARELAKKRKKKKKLLQDGSTDMNNDNNNSDKNNTSRKQNKNLYKIFSILNNNKPNSNKESNDENENLLKLAENINIFNDFTDMEYRELLNKKEEYLETNMRLDNNIKNFSKTKNSKLSKITKSLKLKEVQLKIIKEKNRLVQDEVNNLENIYQLSLEKEKIRKEIEKKMNQNKRKASMNLYNSPLSSRKNKTIEKNLNIIDKINLNSINNTDRKTSLEMNNYNYNFRNLSTIKKVRKDIDFDETNSDNYFPDTREEQLQLIKKKYIEDENNNNDIENQNEELLHVIENDNNSENKSNEGENDEDEDEKFENYNNDINIKNKKHKNNDDNKNYDDEEIGQINYKALKLEQAPFKI